MTLHVPNKDAGSFTKAWQNNFWEIVLTLQRNFQTLRDAVAAIKAIRNHPPGGWASDGEEGEQGSPGERGLRGVQGVQGVPVWGEEGEEGAFSLIPGPPGPAGSGGSSATTYFEDVTNGDADFPEVTFHNGDIVVHLVSI
jgi:hypothetical protein